MLSKRLSASSLFLSRTPVWVDSSRLGITMLEGRGAGVGEGGEGAGDAGDSTGVQGAPGAGRRVRFLAEQAQQVGASGRCTKYDILKTRRPAPLSNDTGKRVMGPSRAHPTVPILLKAHRRAPGHLLSIQAKAAGTCTGRARVYNGFPQPPTRSPAPHHAALAPTHAKVASTSMPAFTLMPAWLNVWACGG